MKTFILATLTMAIACSSQKPTNAPSETMKMAIESWYGRDASELESHPVFKYMQLNKKENQNGEETWIFRQRPRYQAGPFCDTPGNCRGFGIYNCDVAFKVKDGKISSGASNGSCPDPKELKPKHIQ